MEPSKPHKPYSRLVIAFLLMGVFWTVLIAALASWAVRGAKDNTTVRTLLQARAFFQQIVITRDWNSRHGGVYVPVTKETQPNPYLDVPRRDVVTKDGQKLTLINPAYMTRQISEIAAARGIVQFHITSQQPVRPGNAPANWETNALTAFKTGLNEYSGWWLPGDDEKSAFRYMAPLWTEKSCLACHAKQGYKEGELRGGISVTIPAREILSDLHLYERVVGARYFVIWIIGMAAIGFFFRFSRNEYMMRSRLIDKLEAALKDVKAIKGFIPICASCRKVRNDEGSWDQIEKYIREHSDAEFSHGICPDCRSRLYPEFTRDKEPKK